MKGGIEPLQAHANPHSCEKWSSLFLKLFSEDDINMVVSMHQSANELSANIVLQLVLWRCWLNGRKGIWPGKKLSGGVLAWLSVWSEVQTCIWPSWCHCHSLSVASVKSRLVLPFWYRLTRVLPEKGPLNGCVCVCSGKLEDRGVATMDKDQPHGWQKAQESTRSRRSETLAVESLCWRRLTTADHELHVHHQHVDETVASVRDGGTELDQLHRPPTPD